MDDAPADLILALQILDLADRGDHTTDHNGEEVEGDTLRDARIARDSTVKNLATTRPSFQAFVSARRLAKPLVKSRRLHLYQKIQRWTEFLSNHSA